MIRSSKHTLKYTNKEKLAQLQLFIKDYRSLLGTIIDVVWENGLDDFSIQDDNLNCPSFLPNDFLKQFDSDFTARMKQCVGKQACSMIRSVVAKRKKLLWRISKAKDEKIKEHLGKKLEKETFSKPEAKYACPEIDARFVDFQEGDHFDYFVRLKTIRKGEAINIPVKMTKPANKWLKRGKLKQAIRLSNKYITLMYEIPDMVKEGGRVVGADQGSITTLTLSDGQTTTQDIHGHTLASIQAKLARRLRNSKGFRRAQRHRENHINWSINQLDLSNIREVRLEKIRDIRRGKRTSKSLKHWTYPLIKEKVETICEDVGCKFTEVDNAFRSQRCNQCGWVKKANRKGKRFRCNLCLYNEDADYNASVNLELDLVEVPFWLRSQKLNRKGFYWMPKGFYTVDHQRIVGDT
jgi:transposase